MGCFFKYELNQEQCVYWEKDGCQDTETNCGNSDALCNLKIVESQQLKETIKKAFGYLYS